jgi:hypothetical protein
MGGIEMECAVDVKEFSSFLGQSVSFQIVRSIDIKITVFWDVMLLV